jgi:hypothetical protein
MPIQPSVEYRITSDVYASDNILVTDPTGVKDSMIFIGLQEDYVSGTLVSEIKANSTRIYLGDMSTFNWADKFPTITTEEFHLQGMNLLYCWSSGDDLYELVSEFSNQLESSSWTLISTLTAKPQVSYKVSVSNFNNLRKLGKLVPGATYEVTNACSKMYDDGTNKGITLYLQALSPYLVNSSGKGKFYNYNYYWSLYGRSTRWDELSIMKGRINSVTSHVPMGTIVTANNGATAKVLFIETTNNVDYSYLEYISGDWNTATSISGGGLSSATIQVPFYNPAHEPENSSNGWLY